LIHFYKRTKMATNPKMAGKGFFEETQEKLVNRDPTTLGILVAVLVGFFTLAIIFFLTTKKKFGRGILLCGTCDSGKTTLLGQLIKGKPLETYTSMKENCGVLVLGGKKPVNLVDVPGHERIRDNILNNYAGSARGIIYIIDSALISKQIRDVTEFLFNILSRPDIFRTKPRLLVACNKQDVGLVKGATSIESMLEKEITALRVSRSIRLDGTDGEGVDQIQIGKPGSFLFKDLGMKVEFIEISAQDADTLGPLKDWISAVA